MRAPFRLLAFLATALSLAGGPAATQSISALKNHDISQPIEWEADRSELLGREDVALFIGHVVVTQGGLSMRSDRLHVFYSLPEGSSDPVVERLDATGSVLLRSESETASADWGVYDVSGRIITLGGSVELVRGDTRLSGERLAIDLVSGVTRLDGDPAEGEEGRIRGRFVLPPANSSPDKPSGGKDGGG